MQEAKAGVERADKLRAAEYVADLTGDLARIARENEFHTLGYLLDMAHLEAQNWAGNPAAGRSAGKDGSPVR
jgi:hypothetical protein